MQLIVFSGLPCTGKSTVAETVGRQLGIPVFAKDWLEATLKRCGWGQGESDKQNLGYTGYELLTTLAQRQLSLGQSAILDSVASMESTRAQWRSLAQNYNAAWRVIECICSDSAIHRARLAERQRKIPDWHELDWSEIERVQAYYEPWSDECLVLDTADSLHENIQRALAYLSSPEFP
jgi:hypothetical protein